MLLLQRYRVYVCIRIHIYYTYTWTLRFVHILNVAFVNSSYRNYLYREFALVFKIPRQRNASRAAPSSRNVRKSRSICGEWQLVTINVAVNHAADRWQEEPMVKRKKNLRHCYSEVRCIHTSDPCARDRESRWRCRMCNWTVVSFPFPHYSPPFARRRESAPFTRGPPRGEVPLA